MTTAGLTGDSFIGGQWRRGAGGAFGSTAPADGAAIWRGAEASDADVDDGGRRGARRRWPPGGGRRWKSGSRWCDGLRRWSSEHKAEMAALISRETGKALWDAATEAGAMVGKAELSVKAYDERTPTRDSCGGRLHRAGQPPSPWRDGGAGTVQLSGASAERPHHAGADRGQYGGLQTVGADTGGGGVHGAVVGGGGRFRRA